MNTWTRTGREIHHLEENAVQHTGGFSVVTKAPQRGHSHGSATAQHLNAESQLKDHRASYGSLDFSREPLRFPRWRTTPMGLCFWGSLCILKTLRWPGGDTKARKSSGICMAGAEGGSMRETDPWQSYQGRATENSKRWPTFSSSSSSWLETKSWRASPASRASLRADQSRQVRYIQSQSYEFPAYPSVNVDQPKILRKGAISGHPDYLKLLVLQGKTGFDFEVSSPVSFVLSLPLSLPPSPPLPVSVYFILGNICYLVLSVMYGIFFLPLILEYLDRAKLPSRPLNSGKRRNFEFRAQGYLGHSTYSTLVINV